jgi:hypothetical protein
MFITEPALLIRMLLGHFAADFLLQSKSMVDKKGKGAWKSGWLHVHAAVYTALVFLAAAKWTTWYWLVPGLYLSHFLIDGWKARRGNRTWTFVGDQLAHLAALAILFGFLGGSGPQAAHGILQRLWHSPRSLLVILAYLLVLWPAGRLMNVMIGSFRQQLTEDKSRGLELAGLWIGCLERSFLLTFILFDYLPGIALLLGLKSLFRFGEIKDPGNRKETEYILIGTLLSFGFALATGLALKSILKNLP